MQKLLLICGEFADVYRIEFNANKSACVTFCPSRHRPVVAKELPTFIVGGQTIEKVNQWCHLGHLINNHLTDDDIISRRNSFVGQANNFLGYFSKLDSLIKNRLFKVYCSSFYGCEIWDLYSQKIDDFCIAWRKGARKVWALPGDASCDILYLIADVLPVFDEIFRRVLNFIFVCCNCDSPLVKYIANFGVNFAHMNSPMGSNALFCSLRYNVSLQQVCI